ncbi:hypothetical protein E1A91_A13G106600v1 [Gossypium mustelinum]|uniref:DUF7866 domain-containing protein n=1 Tax=Gossypium mustelinum TaxID=34275 RepID=A0A5D2WGJ0_GOSMU|nr:hypothetical protein E1A91_A13G106600v1 [Gossypium mustelinum]
MPSNEHHQIKVNESLELVPLVDKKMVKMMMFNESRRKLGTFQICAACICCGGAKGVCLPSPCCYAINCNIPNRPFGFCSFTPKTLFVLMFPLLQLCFVLDLAQHRKSD